MDNIDRQIINILLNNSRISYAELAKIVGLSLPALRERVLNLKSKKIIAKYSLELNYKNIGFPIEVVMFVELSVNGSDVQDELKKVPNILSCKSLAGKQDLMLTIRVKSTEELLKLSERIRTINGVAHTDSSIVLHEYFNQNKLVDLLHE